MASNDNRSDNTVNQNIPIGSESDDQTVVKNRVNQLNKDMREEDNLFDLEIERLKEILCTEIIDAQLTPKEIEDFFDSILNDLQMSREYSKQFIRRCNEQIREKLQQSQRNSTRLQEVEQKAIDSFFDDIDSSSDDSSSDDDDLDVLQAKLHHEECRLRESWKKHNDITSENESLRKSIASDMAGITPKELDMLVDIVPDSALEELDVDASDRRSLLRETLTKIHQETIDEPPLVNSSTNGCTTLRNLPLDWQVSHSDNDDSDDDFTSDDDETIEQIEEETQRLNIQTANILNGIACSSLDQRARLATWLPLPSSEVHDQ